MNRLRKLLLVLAAVLILGAVAWAWRPVPVAVSVTPASRGPLQATIVEDGRTRIIERYTVSPPVTGYVPRLALHVGDPVEAGQVLFTLEPLPPAALDVRARAEASARVAMAKAALRAAEPDAQAASASADFAVREQARLRPLFDTGQVSKTQYDRAVTEAERAIAARASARAAIDVARFELQAAETSLRFAAGGRDHGTERVPVASPVAGRVLAVHREDEGVVNAGAPIITLGDPQTLDVVIDVLSADAVRIAPGMRVRFERWGGDAPLEGRVRTVDPTAFTKVSALGVEEQRVQVVADFVAPPAARAGLGDAFRVEARFVLWETDDALRVPHSSLFRVDAAADAGWAVFVVEDGVARTRRVQVGQLGVLHAQVLEGIDEGEAVISYPDDRLQDGLKVSIVETESP